jgi:DNA-binding LacI/PurR family transcriptional regulator
MATIYDIAKAAGVTAATVSNVFSGKGSVGATTKARILKYADELGYRPNLIARSLTRGRTGIIGLILPSIDNLFYGETTTIVERLAYAADLRIFATTLSGDDQAIQKMLMDLTLWRVDGFLIACGSWALQTMHLMITAGYPIVYCFGEEEKLEGGPPCVSVDFAHAGVLAAEHLLSLGHRHMGIITHIVNDGQLLHPVRVRSFQETLSLRGLSVSATYIQDGQANVAYGKAAALKLLTLPDPPTAIFATNDLMAMGALSAASELGIHVPRDLSIVGLDDISLVRYLVPPLTSIVIDREAIVTQAMALLLNAIEGQEVKSPPTFPVTLIVRGSTGPVSGTSSLHF